jgi:peptide/nickel transport system substrate-binding protein
MHNKLPVLAAILLAGLVVACNAPTQPAVTPSVSPVVDIKPSATMTIVTPTPTDQATAIPPRVLTVCLGQEPRSLFLYQAVSPAERSVLQALYDGPVDALKDGYHPVILSHTPSLDDGSVAQAVVDVAPGSDMVDASGEVAILQAGTRYYPAGCTETSCVQAYQGDQPVQMTQLTIKYDLLPGLTWSDGAALTADDSVYSYEVAGAVFSVGQGRLDVTASYQAIDAQTIEWRGLPGMLNVDSLAYFFTPLPRHAWEGLSTEQLLTDEKSSRLPLGWGPYVITEWKTGDHISLQKNAAYFRSGEGLPHFDYLVYRFVKDGEEALDALLTGECDVIDPSAALELQIPRLQQLQQESRLKLAYLQDIAWELLAFNIESLNPTRPPLLAQAQVRQAVALCINRQELAHTLMYDQANVPDSFLPSSYANHAPGLAQYAYDPQAAADLLQQAGWLDVDGDPTTPRLSLGVPGVSDNTPFSVTYLVSSDAERSAAATAIQVSLAACGIQVNLEFREPSDYLATGPAGPVFGRDFDMAQFALPSLLSPPCQLFTSEEIPGPYPTFVYGWAGVNVSGYRNLGFDAACQATRATLPGTELHQSAQTQAQAIFASDLPVLPLYTRFKVMATRPDVCQLSLENAYQDVLWNLEELDKADGCRP